MKKKKIKQRKENRKDKKRGFFEGLDFDFFWGTKGMKVSFLCLLVLKFFLVVFLYVRFKSLSEIGRIIFDFPLTAGDYMAIFAGIILFIAVPFLLGIRIGVSMKKKIRKKGR